jgi:hypothetical protein
MMLNQRSPESSPPAPSSPSERRKSRFTALGIITPVVSVVVRLLVPGWMILFWGIPLVLAAILHLIVHVSAASRLATRADAPSWLFILSNLLCFLGFGLQPDFGDGGEISFGFYRAWNLVAQGGNADSALIDSQTWYNILSFVSVTCLLGLLLTWIVIGIRTSSRKEKAMTESA